MTIDEAENVQSSQPTGKKRILKNSSIRDFASLKAAWIACLILILVFSASLGGLIWLLRTPDNTVPAFRDDFEAMRGLDAQWDTEILSLQLGVSPNYDAVTDAANNLKLGLQGLQSTIARQQSLSPLAADFKSYVNTVNEKSRLAEQMKASYAMLRNSMSVLPDAIADSFADPDSLKMDEPAKKRIADLVTEVITGLVSFSTSPSPLLRETVMARIETARRASRRVSPNLQRSLERFLLQVEVAAKERQRGNDLILSMSSIPTDSAADRVQNKIQLLEAEQADRYKLLWYATALLCLPLSLSIISLLFVLRQNYIKVGEDNKVLQQANHDVEERLLQSAKLTALGQMVAGITHEINTPLAYVKAVFEVIKERLTSDPEIAVGAQVGEKDEALREKREEMQLLLEDGLHGIEEITTLVKTMKNFSRLDKGHIESFSVEEGIESALLIAKPQLKYVADIRREFDFVPPIMGSPSQLRQVLLNLIVNAADAMAESGRRGTLTLRTRITSSDTVEIDVCDDGPGMTEEQITKIFDPFYTTKAVGKGTGMGLSICYRIIENHGGTITVNSKLGKGAVFTITLPRQDDKYSDFIPQMEASSSNANI
ncbi:ATP-binding protein [Rhizobium sp. NFACC06-2]|uniref:ATP-binding protein n=1 Tax=Rhizobium sp. NFACC06-2 TaxID=1566264 RepID=UPI0008764156|nr:ATP-binding protein [Rhizobium sp. NFACC06-2]SCY90482.1 His Kinase A (phospho-acceptor) domain-containing protein [Rhizobium sp. NFACC06-2]